MLLLLRDLAPEAFQGSVLIGGAACWAYRMALAGSIDPDFPAPVWSLEEESLWLSKDVDFANAEPPVIPDHPDLRIGFVQFGIRLGPDDFLSSARPLAIETEGRPQFTILIADPLDLYREKEAAAARRGLPSDRLHLRALSEYLKLTLVQTAERIARSSEPSADWSRLATRVKSYVPELLRDSRVIRRLRAIGDRAVLSGLGIEQA